jgi:putative transposase
MARPLRIEFEGAWYHVMNRGLSHKSIFEEDNHYEAFIQLLNETSLTFAAEYHSYCLMSNHYHLLIHTPRGNLSRIMRHIDGIYTQRFNRNTHRDGPLFRGRYKAIIIDKDNYLAQVSRYIHLNPVSAKIVRQAEKYQWSSYRYFLNPLNKPGWLCTDEVLNLMNSQMPNKAYHHFVSTDTDKTIQAFYEKRKQSTILGSKTFKKTCLEKIKIENKSESKPEFRRTKDIPALEDIMKTIAQYYGIAPSLIKKSQRGHTNEPRNMLILIARLGFGYSNQTISDAITSITPPAISCFTCQSKKLIQQDNRMKNTFNELLSIFENNDNLKHET